MDARSVGIVAGALSTLALALALAAACGEPSSTAAGGAATTTSSSASAGPGSGAAPSCTAEHPEVCGPGAYCLVPSCTGTGSCAAASEAASGYAPLCACDGVTYWNGLLAIAAKATIQRATACGGEGARCDAGSDTCSGLGARTFCNVAVDGGAGCPLPTAPAQTPQGTCWALPDCAGAPNTGYGCMDPGNCKTACALVEAQLAWWETPCTP